mgnify:CR=1 FL=1
MVRFDAHTFIVAVLTVYFLISIPRIRATLYRFAPNSRRPRTVLIGDEVCAKVGAYLLGNVVRACFTTTSSRDGSKGASPV